MIQASSSLGPFDISSSTQKVDTRARARAIALKIENTSSSQSWKLGTFRLDIQPDGRDNGKDSTSNNKTKSQRMIYLQQKLK